MTQPAAVSSASSPRAQPAPQSAAVRSKLLLEAPILPTLLRLSAPNVLNLLAFAGVITFDGFFLGRIGTNALAGASLAFPWVMLVLQATNSGMGAGVSSAVARALGAGQKDKAVDDLLDMVRADRKWNDEAARKQLVKFFEAFGPMDPLTIQGRRRLSSILFK